MQGTFIGFNTASIKYEDKFLALMLKVKLSNQLCQSGNDSNLLIVFYVQIVPDDFVMQLHRF